jgi:hypothetical protein
MMRKCNLCACALLLAAVLLAPTSARAWTAAFAPRQQDQPVAQDRPTVAQTAALLQRPFDTKNFRVYMNLDSFFDLLPDNLAKQKIALKIVVDREAFEQEHKDFGSPFDVHLQFPADDRQATVAQALRYALSYLPDDNAAIVPKANHVLLTTKKRANVVPQLKQMVQAAFDDCPLATALQRLADLTDTSIVVAPEAAKQAQLRVSAVFRNDVTLTTALRVLTEMAELTAVVQEGVLLVTTPAHAKALAKQP